MLAAKALVSYHCGRLHSKILVAILDPGRGKLPHQGSVLPRFPVGFQNSATGRDLGFYTACSHSVRRPPRTGRRLIRSRGLPL